MLSNHNSVVVLLCLCLLGSGLAFDFGHEDNLDLVSMAQDDFSMRTFNGFNSTSLLLGLGVVAVLVLVVGVGLYLVGSNNIGRTEPLPDPNYNYYDSQYQNAEQAYPYVHQQQAYYRYNSLSHM